MRLNQLTASLFGLFALSLTVSASADVETLGWSDLVPAEGEGIQMFLPLGTEVLGLPEREEGMTDEDYAWEIAYISAYRDFQPGGAKLNDKLDGKVVRVPGYVTPLGFEEEVVSEFLLVPFLGACLHVPPPPANQIVYVTEAEGLELEQLYSPIYVTGTLSAKPVSTILAEVGYTIKGAKVERYTGRKELEPPRSVH